MNVLILATLFFTIGLANAVNEKSGGINGKTQINADTTNSGDQTKRVLDDSPANVHNNDKNEGEAPQKRMYGYLLGNGFATGKRTSNSVEKRPYGWMLGRGLFAKKSGQETITDDLTDVDLNGPVDDDEKKWIGDAFGTGYDFDFKKRSKRDIPDKRFIRYFGHMLGRGYAFGKREADTMYVKGDMTPDSEDEDDIIPITIDPADIEDLYEDDDGEYLIPDQDNDGEELDEDMQVKKRYFNSDPGYRFLFGKKRSNKKRYGYVLGNGFTFGKRSNNPDVDERNSVLENQSPSELDLEKRIGLVLGRGFRMGTPRRRSWVFSQGYPMGKRSDDMGSVSIDGENGLSDSYILLDDMGNIHKPEKRFVFSQGYRFGRRAHPKRYGYVLGSGFRFGKRDTGLLQAKDKENAPEKRGWGYVLGRGFQFGKRMGYRRRFGSILGSGFAFGKRSSSMQVESEKGSEK